MKKVKVLVVSIVLIAIQSCNSQTTSKEIENKKEDETKTNAKFDLINLTLNENISDILKDVNLSKKDTIKSDFNTLLGNEKLVFDSDKVLVFNKEKLSGKGSLGVNNVIFYYGKIDKEIGPLYNEKDNIIGMCQINLYDKTMSDELFNTLNQKFNKPEKVFELESIKTYLWIKNNISYYYFTKDSDDFYRILFIFKKKDIEWIDFIGGLGFGSINL
jgi:hypothetical protein